VYTESQTFGLLARIAEENWSGKPLWKREARTRVILN